MEYRDFAVDLAQKAGQIIRTNFTLGMKKEWKENNTPLTETDTAINRMVIEAIEKAYPDHGVLGEEESLERTNTEYLWICDPVDGTIPFSYGLPVSTFSLALVKDGTPILAAVLDPYMDRLFVAEKGQGATLNGKPIMVSSTSSLNQTGLGIEGSAKTHPGVEQLPYLLKQQGAKIFRLNSYIYSGVLVAAGELVGAVYAGKNPWDAVTIQLIVEEAGGKATDLQGKSQRYDGDINGIVATNGHIHDELLDHLAQSEVIATKV